MSSATAGPDDGLSAFLSVRPRLFGIAYRMLGRAVEAEDIVQDVWVRWQTADRSLVRDAAAFLTTTATRLAINLIAVSTLAPGNLRRPLAAGTSRYPGRPAVGSGTGPGAGVWGSVAAGNADSHRTSRLHPSGGVRLPLPRHRERPSASGSQRAASGDAGSQARRQWPRHNAAPYPVNDSQKRATAESTRHETAVGGTAMKRTAALTLSLSLAGGTLVAAGRHSPITVVQGSRRGSPQRDLDDHCRVPARRIEPRRIRITRRRWSTYWKARS